MISYVRSKASEYCSKATIEEARDVIAKFIEKNKKPIKKIHKY